MMQPVMIIQTPLCPLMMVVKSNPPFELFFLKSTPDRDHNRKGDEFEPGK
jgi:hypothetical protein